MAAALGALPTLIGGIIGGKLIESAIGGGGSAPAPTTPTAQPVMPQADDQKVKDAKKKSIAMQLQRGGRDSTILTSGSDSATSTTLGG